MDHATLDMILDSLNPGLDDNLPIDEHYVYVGSPRFDTPEVLGEDDLVVILDNGSYWDRHAAQFSPHDFTWRYHSAPLNLFEVIDHLLKSNGYLWRDISWIGSRDLEIPIRQFKCIAIDTFYFQYESENAYSLARDLAIHMRDGSYFYRSYAAYRNGDWVYDDSAKRPPKIASADIVLVGNRQLRKLDVSFLQD